MFGGHLRFPVTWGAVFNPAPSSATRPHGTEQALNVSLPRCSLRPLIPTMFLVLTATEELKEFFAKARAGSVRLIKVVIEDGECPYELGHRLGAGPSCFSGKWGVLTSSPLRTSVSPSGNGRCLVGERQRGRDPSPCETAGNWN